MCAATNPPQSPMKKSAAPDWARVNAPTTPPASPLKAAAAPARS